jgi:cytochrome c-type biogenesis protein CcmH/NrfG
MRYWKGLLIAVAFDTALIAGPDFLATEPPPPAQSQAIQWPASNDLDSLDRLVDSLMQHLQEHVDDVDAMLAVARLYAEHGWPEDAIGPLARALQLDPYRRDLWVALDRALEQSGRAKITDAELTGAAREFALAIEMRGHGC